MNLQLRDGKMNLLEATPDQVKAARFIRFWGPGAEAWSSRARVYVNPRPDATPALMRALVREVVDDQDEFAGVRVAKVANPEQVSNTTDVIIVYASSEEAADRVVRWLDTYRLDHPDTLDDATPPRRFR